MTYMSVTATLSTEDEAYPEAELLPKARGVESLWRADEPDDLDDGPATPAHDRPPQDDERSGDSKRNAGDAEKHGKLEEPGQFCKIGMLGLLGASINQKADKFWKWLLGIIWSETGWLLSKER